MRGTRAGRSPRARTSLRSFIPLVSSRRLLVLVRRLHLVRVIDLVRLAPVLFPHPFSGLLGELLLATEFHALLFGVLPNRLLARVLLALHVGVVIRQVR